MNKKDIKKMLTKDINGETILFVIISVVTLVIGILIMIGKLTVKADLAYIGENPIVFGAILSVLSVIALLYGGYGIYKNVYYKNYSLLYKMKEANEEKIKNKFSVLSSDKVEINNLEVSYFVVVVYKNVEFTLWVEEKTTGMYIDLVADDDTNYSDEVFYEIDDLSVALKSTKVTKDEVLDKFYNYINTNLYVVEKYGKK